MSNHKNSYGWSGHIIVPAGEFECDVDSNVVAVPANAFQRLVRDYYETEVDCRIHVERIGVIESDAVFLACGTGFSGGFTHYGTVFGEAELRQHSSPHATDRDANYLAAMKEIYGIELPPCRLMIGCSSEH